MNLVDNPEKCVVLAVVSTLFWLASPTLCQSAATPSTQIRTQTTTQITTQERLETEAWWPTSPNSALDAFAGSASCSKCHDQGNAAHLSSMRRASARATAISPLAGDKPLELRYQGLAYSVASGPGAIEYSVSSGAHKLSRKLDWVMGAGDLGETFLYQSDGRWYQSNMSHYTRLSALDLTTGLHVDTAPSLSAALGTLLSPEDARSCFGCHTVHATSSAGFNPGHAEAGLGCEACHGPARDHAASIGNATPSPAANDARTHAGGSSIFNPAKLSPADSIDFCGACHRSFADAALSIGPGAGTAVVRFQPYRLEESKCWRATQDARLTCVACHDPHQPLNRDTASYDRHCLGCHSAAATSPAAHSAKMCPRATSDCISCHMPRVALVSMHGEFTDHFIRIVRSGEPLPQ